MVRILFKAAGILFIISGALFLFMLIVSAFSGFGPDDSAIPSVYTMGTTGGVTFLENVLIFAGTLVLSIGLMLTGFILMELPDFIGSDQDIIEKKVKRLEIVVWRVFNKMKAAGK